MTRADMIPGTVQAKDESSGMNDLPLSPIWDISLSIRICRPSHVPQSSRHAIKRNNTRICGRNRSTLPTPSTTPFTSSDCNAPSVIRDATQSPARRFKAFDEGGGGLGQRKDRLKQEQHHKSEYRRSPQTMREHPIQYIAHVASAGRPTHKRPASLPRPTRNARSPPSPESPGLVERALPGCDHLPQQLAAYARQSGRSQVPAGVQQQSFHEIAGKPGMTVAATTGL